MSSQPTYISSDDLATLLCNKTLRPGIDYQVIDVRDDDFIGGFIVGAVNVPSSQIFDRLEYLVANYSKVPHVIFHCALSQVRGPKSARIYREALAKFRSKDQPSGVTVADESRLNHDRVSVLQGGFSHWQAKFKNHPEREKYLQDYDEELWSLENEY